MANTSKRGFASMDPEKQREIASRGGRAAHAKGTAHRFTPEEARVAGRKGGEASRGGRGRSIDGSIEPSGLSGGALESGLGSGSVSNASQGMNPNRQLGAERSYESGSGLISDRQDRQDRQIGGDSSVSRDSGYDDGSEGRGSF
jgi:general stress protein YciG